MQVISSIEKMKQARKKLIGSVGFVPTMGFLHEGHLTLVRRAKRKNDITVVSIFVNPTQFSPGEDFAQYPRDTEHDLALLEKEGVDIIFIPIPNDMYPDSYNTWVETSGITEMLEGQKRPSHFRGVTTIVNKLFNIIMPHKAYFGQKDGQQLRVIQKMVRDLNMHVKIVPVPTVREKDGLAMSSRNAYLNDEERKAALVLYKALIIAEEMYMRGEHDASRIRVKMTGLINKEHLAKIDYISIADSDTLEELTYIDHPALVSMAVKIGKTRLIDNRTIG
ncbi:pantoate--beta-alanine ligase [Chloroflexota bacterium]